MIEALPPESLLVAAFVLLMLMPQLARTLRRAGGRRAGTDRRRSRPEIANQRASGPRAPVFPTVTELSGKAHIIDGDTLVIQGIKVRLAGIDAPELDQPFGQKSKWALIEICRGQVITAKFNGETSHDRFVGSCYLPDGRDVAADLIQRGLALDWARFSGGKYRHLEPAGIRQKLSNLQTWR